MGSGIAAHLAKDPALVPLVKARPGLRGPGAWDGFGARRSSASAMREMSARVEKSAMARALCHKGRGGASRPVKTACVMLYAA